MIPKSGYRFSDKIMLKQQGRARWRFEDELSRSSGAGGQDMVTEGNEDVSKKPGTKLIVLLACAGVVSVALAGRIGFDLFATERHAARGPQPRTQLTVKLDTSAVPQVLVREMSEDVRRLMRETRIGFAAMAPSGDHVDVTIRDGVDRAQA